MSKSAHYYPTEFAKTAEELGVERCNSWRTPDSKIRCEFPKGHSGERHLGRAEAKGKWFAWTHSYPYKGVWRNGS